MAKRRNRYSGKNDFSLKIDHIGRRVENASQRFSNRFEKKFEKVNYWYEGFSIIGPVIASMIRLIGFAIVIWLLEFVNSFLGIRIITSIDAFLLSNLGLFFVVFLAFSYISFLVRNFPRLHFFLRPLFFASGFSVAAWLAKSSIIASRAAIENQELFNIAIYMQENLLNIFMIILAVGYFALAFDIAFKSAKKNTSIDFRTKRLYRSTKEKVIGGVCGGISEYIGIDPVIIRLIWVAFALVWGYGVLLYLIAWIIIPVKTSRR